jgi:hypothetical protein
VPARRILGEHVVIIDEIGCERRLMIAPDAPGLVALQAVDVERTRLFEFFRQRGIGGVAQIFARRPHESAA